MNKLILIFLLLGVLGFSKDKTLTRDKKISEEKRKFLLKLSELTSNAIFPSLSNVNFPSSYFTIVEGFPVSFTFSFEIIISAFLIIK